jgi:hypothetical protein
MNDEQSNGYQTYLLRLWRAQCQGTWQWRASLESRHTGERQLFASLEQLFAFLGERCDSQTSGAPDTYLESSRSLEHRSLGIADQRSKKR